MDRTEGLKTIRRGIKRAWVESLGLRPYCSLIKLLTLGCRHPPHFHEVGPASSVPPHGVRFEGLVGKGIRGSGFRGIGVKRVIGLGVSALGRLTSLP